LKKLSLSLYILLFISLNSFCQISDNAKTLSGNQAINIETNNFPSTNVAVPFIIVAPDGKYYPAPVKMETQSRTITFSNTMTTAQINNRINEVGKYITKNVTIIFLFASGTYTNQGIGFNNFHGLGSITIKSPDTTTSPYTTQTVIFDPTSQGAIDSVINLQYNRVPITILNMHFKHVSGQSLVYGYNSENISVNYCYFEGAGTYGLRGVRGTYFSYANYFNGQFLAHYFSIGCILRAQNNWSTGTNPGYGYAIYYGSYCGTYDNHITAATTLYQGIAGGYISGGYVIP
jgi:hypothetical protein